MTRTQVFSLSFFVLLLLAFFGYRHMAIVSALDKQPIPAPAFDEPSHAGLEKAVFAGGCFWGTQTVFQQVKGVHPDRGRVCGAARRRPPPTIRSPQRPTGHAESVEITFDPSKITYGTLLRIFFSVAHDPTEVNRQGPDVGTSYRSAIFYSSEEQHRIAQRYIQQLDQAHVLPRQHRHPGDAAPGLLPAEEYHQDYAIKNPGNPLYSNLRRTQNGSSKGPVPATLPGIQAPAVAGPPTFSTCTDLHWLTFLNQATLLSH